MDTRLGDDVPRIAGCTIVLSMSGCGVAPSVSFFGSFFPAWLICILVGVVLAILSRQVLVAIGLAPYVRPAIVVYPCLTALWSFATWLVVFGG
jgi:hypothetical protein